MLFFRRLMAKIRFLLSSGTKSNKRNTALIKAGAEDKYKPQLAINDDGGIHYFGVNTGEANVIEEESVNYRKKKDDNDDAAVIAAAAYTNYSYGDYDESVSTRDSSSTSSSSSSSGYSSGYSSYGDSSSSSSCDSGGGGGCD